MDSREGSVSSDGSGPATAGNRKRPDRPRRVVDSPGPGAPAQSPEPPAGEAPMATIPRRPDYARVTVFGRPVSRLTLDFNGEVPLAGPRPSVERYWEVWADSTL